MQNIPTQSNLQSHRDDQGCIIKMQMFYLDNDREVNKIISHLNVSIGNITQFIRLKL